MGSLVLNFGLFEESPSRTIEGRVMTTTQGAELRAKWRERINPPPCEHLTLKLERTETGYLTGNYNCTVCGEAVAQVNK